MLNALGKTDEKQVPADTLNEIYFHPTLKVDVSVKNRNYARVRLIWTKPRCFSVQCMRESNIA